MLKPQIITAGVCTAGSILEGPDSAKLKPLVEQVLPILLQLMKDPVVAVKVGLAGGCSEKGVSFWILGAAVSMFSLCLCKHLSILSDATPFPMGPSWDSLGSSFGEFLVSLAHNIY